MRTPNARNERAAKFHIIIYKLSIFSVYKLQLDKAGNTMGHFSVSCKSDLISSFQNLRFFFDSNNCSVNKNTALLSCTYRYSTFDGYKWTNLS